MMGGERPPITFPAHSHCLPGLFVVLEGPDASGKTTLLDALAEHFERLGLEVLTTEEPYTWRAREQICSGVLPNNKQIEVLDADRAYHLSSLIVPALKAGKVVICSRYYHSTVAYQGIRARGGPRALAQAQGQRHIAPDLVALQNLSLHDVMTRLQARGGADALEVPQKQREAIRMYGRMSAPNILRVSGRIDPRIQAAIIVSTVLSRRPEFLPAEETRRAIHLTVVIGLVFWLAVLIATAIKLSGF